MEAEFGRGFSEKSLRHMLRFAEAFPDERIVSALRRQLGWTHFKSIIYLDDELKRDFYAKMCRIEKWSTRTLEKKIGGTLYERTALSKKPDKLIRQELAALREEEAFKRGMEAKSKELFGVHRRRRVRLPEHEAFLQQQPYRRQGGKHQHHGFKCRLVDPLQDHRSQQRAR